MDINTLKKLGFSDKSAKLYLVLLSLGPSSVRKLAESTGLNRGIIYEILKDLQEMGVVKYYKEETKQLFVAEDPEKLREIIWQREQELKEMGNGLNKLIPELQALYNPGGDRPVAKYYTHEEISLILEDVLKTCDDYEEKSYRVYSSQCLREEIYNDFPTFSDARIAKSIKVKVIAIGEGGELRGLDERKWLNPTSQQSVQSTSLQTSPARTASESTSPKRRGDDNLSSTYIIIYPGKTAYISQDAKKELVGVVIENDGVYQTQKMIFENLWKAL
jgi:sugar-specific transcriptional regulator TrmB